MSLTNRPSYRERSYCAITVYFGGCDSYRRLWKTHSKKIWQNRRKMQKTTENRRKPAENPWVNCRQTAAVGHYLPTYLWHTYVRRYWLTWTVNSQSQSTAIKHHPWFRMTETWAGVINPNGLYVPVHKPVTKSEIVVQAYGAVHKPHGKTHSAPRLLVVKICP